MAEGNLKGLSEVFEGRIPCLCTLKKIANLKAKGKAKAKAKAKQKHRQQMIRKMMTIFYLFNIYIYIYN